MDIRHLREKMEKAFFNDVSSTDFSWIDFIGICKFIRKNSFKKKQEGSQRNEKDVLRRWCIQASQGLASPGDYCCWWISTHLCSCESGTQPVSKMTALCRWRLWGHIWLWWNQGSSGRLSEHLPLPVSNALYFLSIWELSSQMLL